MIPRRAEAPSNQSAAATTLRTDDAVLSGFDTGVYRWTDGSLGLIARTGTEIHPGSFVSGMGPYGSPDSGAAIDARGQVMFQAFIAGSKVVGTELFRVGGTVPDIHRPG